MTRILIPLLTAGILFTSGLVQGLMSDRWSPGANLLVEKARNRINTAPTRIGDWEGVSRHLSEFDVKTEDGNDNNTVTRQYVNRLNGNTVNVLMEAGYKQNILQWHTPMQCYPANGYELITSEGLKTKVPVEDVQAEFFYADFKLARGSAPIYVRVFWAWSGDGRWLAPELPKIAFGSHTCLHKLYVVRELLRPEEPLASDPCLDFMKVALPRLNQTFFPE